MRSVGALLVAAVLRLYPRSFRRRFADEALETYRDMHDALAAKVDGRAVPLVRHTAATLTGLLRALGRVHLEERRRHTLPVDSNTSRRGGRMQHMTSDLRHALRVLRLNPAFAIVAVVTIALGIGATSAVFSVLDSVVLSPLPYAAPERLVRLYTAPKDDPGAKSYSSGVAVLELRDHVGAFSSVGIVNSYREVGGDVTTGDGVARRVPLLRIGADYFATLGATPLFGRTFTRDEERRDARRVILSYTLWNTLTGADKNVLGRSIQLNGEAYEVIGVMRRSFTDVVARDIAAWIPQDLQLGGQNNTVNHYLSAIARLKGGVTLAQAQSQVDALMSRIDEYPDARKGEHMRVLPLHEDVVGASRSAVYVLMGAAGLVLLIACSNVANLFLARSVTLGRETAVRTALGAPRGRLIRERLTESVVVATVGGVVGSLVAYWSVKLLLAVSPEMLARAEEIRFDFRLFLFALLVTFVTGVLSGVVPALGASRADPGDAMRVGSRGNTGGRASGRARTVLVASQVAIALVLLVGAGVLIRSFIARQRLGLGFSSTGVETFEVNLPEARYDSAARRVRFHAEYQQRLRALRGVRQVGATSWLPAGGDYHQWGFQYHDATGAQRSLAVQVRVVDGEFFTVLGIPLVAGRVFGTAERLGTDGVAVIDHSLARNAFGDRDPLGEVINTGGRDFRVVGIVGDVATDETGRAFSTIYLSHAQFADDRNWSLTYVVKTAGAPDAVVEEARRELAQLDPALVLYRPRSMDAVLARLRARDRFTLMLMAVFAAVALTLAAVGVYGVLSYLVTQRRHEIGVRMALGASPGQVRAIVMRNAMVVGAVGIVVGLSGAFLLSRLLQSLVFGVSARDAAAFVAGTSLLATIVVAAGYLPARRATRVDPLEALRRE